MNTKIDSNFSFSRNKKRTKILLILLISVLILSACGASAPSVTQTPASTFTPVPPTATSTPSPTPTLQLPVSLGTAYPALSKKISVDNVKQIVELARYGKERGVFSSAMLLPDGKFIAVLTSLGIYLFDIETLEQTSFLSTKSNIQAMRYSADGETIVVIVNGKVELWKASDGSLLHTFDIGEEAISGMEISPDGTLLATSFQKDIKIWKVSDGSLFQTFSGHKDKVTNLIFSPDSQILYSGSNISQVISFQIADKKVIREYKTYSTTYNTGLWLTSLSSDGNLLATLGGKNKGGKEDNNLIALWQTSDGQKIWETSFPFNNANGIMGFSLSPDGKHVALAFRDNTVQMWKTGSDNLPISFEKLIPSGLSPDSLAFSLDGKKLILAGNNVMGMWDVSTGSLIEKIGLGTGFLYRSSIAIDGNFLAVAEEDINEVGLRIWNTENGSSKYAYKDIMKGLWDYQYSPDGNFFVTGNSSSITFWPLSGGASSTFSISSVFSPVRMALSMDGQFVAIRGYYGGVWFFSTSDGKEIPYAIISGKGSDFSSLEFSRDGKYMIAGVGVLNLVKIENWKAVKKGLKTTFATFSPDSLLLAYGQDDKTIQVSTLPDLEPVFTIPELPDTTVRLAYSPDETILVSGSDDGTLRFWNAKDGALLYEIEAHTAGIVNMTFLPDENTLLTVSNDGTIRLWGIKP